MKIVAISDTHGRHNELEVPDGDVLVHAGDFTNTGTLTEIRRFADWLRDQPHRYKLVIAGNHDFGMQGPVGKELVKQAGGVYLEDEDVMIEHLRFYGSPWTPRFNNWAFMKGRGEEMAKVWERVPEHLDVLITHGPPLGILDEASREGGGVENAGCAELVKYVASAHPRVHIFGHIHHSYGAYKSEATGTLFLNASVCNEAYEAVNGGWVVELEPQ